MQRYGYVISSLHMSTNMIERMRELGCEVTQRTIGPESIHCDRRHMPNGFPVYDVTLPKGADVRSPPERHTKKRKRVDRHGLAKSYYGRASWHDGERFVQIKWLDGENLLTNPSRIVSLDVQEGVSGHRKLHG